MYDQLTEEQMQDIWNKEAAGEEFPAEAQTEVEAEAVEETQAEQPKVEAEAPAEPDPYEGLPEAVRSKLSEIDEIKQLNQELMHQVKSANGRVAAIQRDMALAQQAKQQVQSSGDEAPSQKQMSAALKNPEKWEALKEDFPDWAEAMEEFVNFRMGNLPKAEQIDPRQVTGYVDQTVQQTREQMARELEMAKLEIKYENWRDEVRTPEFATWMQGQKPEVQMLAGSEKAKDAARMLELYYSAKDGKASAVKQERGARLAVAATQRGSAAPPPKTVDNMSPEELWEYEAKLRAKRKA